MESKKVYQEIASKLLAMKNCKVSNNDEWLEKHKETLKKIIEDYLPHGSGFDSGCEIDYNSNSNKFIIFSSYHLMNDNGYYDGWIDFDVIVKSSLAFGIDVTIKGLFSRLPMYAYGLKDYIHEVFHNSLMETIKK